MSFLGDSSQHFQHLVKFFHIRHKPLNHIGKGNTKGCVISNQKIEAVVEQERERDESYLC